ncbi:ethylene-responsive transcription factor erf025 [Phtheirospermum japonicum]|uniref:Ethylene-responsive transcription factor erf025 n=1 Tax=Phtheirospermum japonicum TaxID=374723 RepID=A0A830DJ58_9LAMI|nr:ethylene-responsive transcription factor erf025 [Phtheirospermum japonicum]
MGIGDSRAEKDYAHMARNLPLAGDGHRRYDVAALDLKRPRCCVELSRSCCFISGAIFAFHRRIFKERRPARQRWRGRMRERVMQKI